MIIICSIPPNNKRLNWLHHLPLCSRTGYLPASHPHQGHLLWWRAACSPSDSPHHSPSEHKHRCIHISMHISNHTTQTYWAKQSTNRDKRKEIKKFVLKHVKSSWDSKKPTNTEQKVTSDVCLYLLKQVMTYIHLSTSYLCMCVCVCFLTFAIGSERSQKGSKTVEQKPQWLQVRELFSCPTNRSGRARNVTLIKISQITGSSFDMLWDILRKHLWYSVLCCFILTIWVSSRFWSRFYSPTILLSSLSRYLLHIFFPFSSSLNTKHRRKIIITYFIE